MRPKKVLKTITGGSRSKFKNPENRGEKVEKYTS